MTCAVCKRESPARKEWIEGTGKRFCSRWCFTAYQEDTVVIDPTPFQLDALTMASTMGGEYLESIHKTDLVTMTVNEWMTFINVVCTAHDVSKQQADGRLKEELEWVRKAPTEAPF